MVQKNFVLIGVGYIAPKHLEAIKKTDNKLIAAFDPNDSVGILDKYFEDVEFFNDFEKFDFYIDKIKENGTIIDYIVVCSPNHLHFSHIKYGLEKGIDVICEKPVVINPSDLELLSKLEKKSNKRIYCILQLRMINELNFLKEKISKEFKDHQKHEVNLKYITSRGKWYFVSWKGNDEKSGGLAMNIGVHLFDLLIWIFGKLDSYEIYQQTKSKIEGCLNLERANVKWFLSIDKNDIPLVENKNNVKVHRLIEIDGEKIGIINNPDLHLKAYQDILDGKGIGIDEAKHSIDLCCKLKIKDSLKNSPEKEYFVHESSYIDDNVKIGKNTKIWRHTSILKDSLVGENCKIGQNVSVGPNVKVGNNCKIQNNVSVCNGVELEDGVFCGPSMVFTNVLTPRSFIDRSNEFQKTLVKEGATVGANATIVCGNTLGKYSFIGAGSVVTKDVPNYALYVGVPARHQGWVCKCGKVLIRNVNKEADETISCSGCSNIYKLTKDSITPLKEN